MVYGKENQLHNASLCSSSGNSDSKACQQLFTILKIEARSQNITITILMHKGMQVHEALNPNGQ